MKSVLQSIFLILLVCVLGYFLAPLVLDVKEAEPSLCNPGHYSPKTRKLQRNEVGKNGIPVLTSSVSLMLCLDELRDVREDERLVGFCADRYEVGLMLTRSGIVGNWRNARWGADKMLSYSRLKKNKNVVTMDGRDYLALTVLTNGTEDLVDSNPGITLVDASGRILLHYPGLYSSYNKHILSIEVNKQHVPYATVNPRACSAAVAGRRARKLEETVISEKGNKYLVFGVGGAVLLVLVLLWIKLLPARGKHQTC